MDYLTYSWRRLQIANWKINANISW